MICCLPMGQGKAFPEQLPGNQNTNKHSQLRKSLGPGHCAFSFFQSLGSPLTSFIYIIKNNICSRVLQRSRTSGIWKTRDAICHLQPRDLGKWVGWFCPSPRSEKLGRTQWWTSHAEGQKDEMRRPNSDSEAGRSGRILMTSVFCDSPTPMELDDYFLAH